MAVFSTQQNRQFYVVTAKKDADVVKGYITGVYPDVTKKGHTALLSIADHNAPVTGMVNGAPDTGVSPFMPLADAFEILHVNVKGELEHSDIIRCNSIRSMRYTKAANLLMKLPTWRIAFNDLTIDTVGSPYTVVAGDGTVFTLRFTFPGFQNATDEEIFTATVAFKWESGAIADAAAKAIADAFRGKYRNINKLVGVASNGVNVVDVWAPEGPWTRGLHSNKPTRIVVDEPKMEVFKGGLGLNTIPGDSLYRVKKAGKRTDITATTTHTVVNSKSIADLEWFCMGERGDQYRLAGWPDYIETEYMVDGSAKYGYDVLDIHYFYRPDGVPGDASEKVLTLVAASADGSTANSDLEDIYEAIRDGERQDNGNDEPIQTDDVNEGSVDIEESDAEDEPAAGTASGTNGEDNAQTTQFTLTMSVNDDTKGSVSASPSSTDGKYDEGTSVTITATPEDTYSFSKWTVNGTDSAETGPLTVTMNADTTVVATFA